MEDHTQAIGTQVDFLLYLELVFLPLLQRSVGNKAKPGQEGALPTNPPFGRTTSRATRPEGFRLPAHPGSAQTNCAKR